MSFAVAPVKVEKKLPQILSVRVIPLIGWQMPVAPVVLKYLSNHFA